MASTETCVHGQPIDGLCIGTCEHGILCGGHGRASGDVDAQRRQVRGKVAQLEGVA